MSELPDSPHDHSRDRFMAGLAQHHAALVALSGDVLFHAQTEVICRSLDVIDTVTDRMTAFRIADALATGWVTDTEAPLHLLTVPPDDPALAAMRAAWDRVNRPLIEEHERRRALRDGEWEGFAALPPGKGPA